jgi:hypothetical protein
MSVCVVTYKTNYALEIILLQSVFGLSYWQGHAYLAANRSKSTGNRVYHLL